MSAHLPLANKRAVVTGGSRGIGAAIVRRLAADGAHVGFTYSASSDAAAALVAEIETEGGRAFALKADSADVLALQAAIASAAKQLGGIDILVNNAGIMIVGAVDNYRLEDFDRMVAINVRSMFFAVQEAIRHMGPGSRIINVGSNIAVRSGFPQSSVYALTKSAIGGMTRALTHDLGPKGITINTIQPGPTATDMTPGDGPMVPRLKSLIPIGRMADASEPASLVAYLAGDEAGFINGAALTIDGGMTV
jgi:3-oxoacyl-[acyl-carrier protein] reductase